MSTRPSARDLAPAEALIELGLTGLEAQVYVALLEEAPATGYRIAQNLGKAAANIYKAIESLEKKGAVLVDGSATKMCRPVAPDELLRRLERSHKTRLARAKTALARLSFKAEDERVYQLDSADQVVERCATMLREAREIALLDAFPASISMLREELEQAAARVTMAVKVYEPTRIKGATVVLATDAKATREGWRGGHWLNLVTDGRESLLALFDERGGIFQAIWTQSSYLGFLLHGGFASEILVDMVRRELGKTESSASVKRKLGRVRKSLFPAALPGVAELRARLGDDEG